MSQATGSGEEWYFDLRKGVAVPASERGPADHVLGPYPTKGEAENWKATKDARNDSWDDEDERWDTWGDGPPDGSGDGSSGGVSSPG